MAFALRHQTGPVAPELGRDVQGPWWVWSWVGSAFPMGPRWVETLWVKAQHEGALPPPCIVRKDPRQLWKRSGTAGLAESQTGVTG